MRAGTSKTPVVNLVDQARRLYPDLGERYEEMIDALADEFIRPGDVVVDGGANMGRHTRSFARRVSPDGHVHAFEPIPTVAQRNQQALRGLKIDKWVTMHQAALWNEAGNAPFSYFPNRPGRSSLRPGPIDGAAEQITVPLVTLDSRLPDTQVSFMKLDVEGAEFHAMRGAKNMLMRCQTLVVFENGLAGSARTFGYTPEDFLNYFDILQFVVLDGFGIPVTLDRFNIKSCGWYFVAAKRNDVLLKRITSVLDRFWGPL